MDSRKDYYRILEILPQAGKEEIRKAFRLLVKRYHPDISDEPDAAERIKEINEAYEVLSDDRQRKAYDEERHTQAAIEKDAKPKQPQRKTSQRSYVNRHERRVFVHGKISVKFWAETTREEQLSTGNIDYLLHPVSAIVYLDENNIFSDEADEAYSRASSQTEIFKSPLRQPVTCLVSGEDGDTYYQLSLHDIRLSHIELKHIVKQDQQSLGTLEGTIYAFAVSETLEEVTETITECSGETGNIRTKQENGWQWIQREIYNADCSTSWGEWKPQFPLRTNTNAAQEKKYHFNTAANRKHNFTPAENREGCSAWWILMLIIFFGLIPQSILPVLGVFLFIFLLSLGARLLRNAATAISVIGLIVLGGAFLRAVVTPGRKTAFGENREARVDTATVTTDKITEKPEENGRTDTVLRHRIQWKSYDSVSYDLYVGIRSSSVRKAVVLRNQLERKNFSSLPEVYHWMNETNAPDLDLTVRAFDSVRNARKLNRDQFAEMIVSCIQSIPYFLIVQDGCNLSEQRDGFIRQYLQQCQTECCMGGVKYGVRSPVEFLEDLRGDCDTRALWAYSLLNAFGYDVAIITSDYYKHAAIAVKLEQAPDADADVIRINGGNFYPWELTQHGYRAGYLPADCGDLGLWDIALMNTKKMSL